MQAELMYTGVAGGLGAFLLMVFKVEFDFPLRGGLLLVPPIVGTGFALAWLIHYRYSVHMFQAFGVLAAVLIILVTLYELWPSGALAGRRRYS
ncbi:MAG: hypothetical protein ABEJ30_07010 [Halorientalis sp.]